MFMLHLLIFVQGSPALSFEADVGSSTTKRLSKLCIAAWDGHSIIVLRMILLGFLIKYLIGFCWDNFHFVVDSLTSPWFNVWVISNTETYLIILTLVLVGLWASQGNQWMKYRIGYFKRKIWLFFGFCPKCGERLSYTQAGRAVCTNGECRK